MQSRLKYGKRLYNEDIPNYLVPTAMTLHMEMYAFYSASHLKSITYS